MTRWAMRPTMRRIVVLVGGLRPPARSCAHCRANGGHGRPHGRGSRHDPSRPTRHRLSRARSGRITPRGGGSREQRRYHSRRADRSFPCCRWGPCDDGPTPCAHSRNVGLFNSAPVCGRGPPRRRSRAGDGGDDKRYASPEARPRDRGCWRIVRHSGLLPPAAAVPARDDRSCATGPGPSTRRSFLWVLWQKSSWPFAISHIIICANHV